MTNSSQLQTDNLRRLEFGFDVPEFGVSLPWNISKSELYEQIPAKHFTYSPCAWPELSFTLFGFRAVFAFNFVSRPGQLAGIQILNFRPRNLRRTFRTSSKALLLALGRPNHVDHPRQNLFWYTKALGLQNSVGKHFIAPESARKPVHFFHLFKAKDESHG